MRCIASVVLVLTAAACGTTEAPRRREDRTLGMLDRLSEQVEGVPENARWRALSSGSFRALYLEDPALAGQVLEAAEQARRAQLAAWLGKGEHPPWSPRCDIHLFPTRRLLVQFNGGDAARAGSAASRRSRLVRGQTLKRVIHLAADEPGLLDSLLPHEVSHIIVGQLMGQKEAPRWADEGLAVLTMSAEAQEGYRQELRYRRIRGQLFPLRQLVAMTIYPDPPYRSLFYAQSMSLVAYLLQLSDRQALLALLRGASSVQALEAGLSRRYGIAGTEELQRRWLAWIER